jgi:hypothetical protein
LSTADWLGLTTDRNAKMSAEAGRFLGEARNLLDELQPLRANDTWAALLDDTLVLVVPLDRFKGRDLRHRGSLHVSVQLMMRTWHDQPEIVGDWQDAHYAWDYEPKNLSFRIRGHGMEPRRQALEWLSQQLRRPLMREDWILLKKTVCSRWRWSDDGKVAEIRGFFPICLAFSHRASRSARAGFFDPW